MEQSSYPFGLRLSDELGVTADRARHILDCGLQWSAGDESKGESWAVRLGRYFRFAGGFRLDDDLKAQALTIIADRVEVVLGAGDDALCKLGDGRTLPAKMVRADLVAWLCFNGIQCPGCGAEMLDWDPDVVLYSDPLQLRVHCVECGHRGYKEFVTPNVISTSRSTATCCHV